MATEKQINKFVAEIAPIIQKYALLYDYKVASPIISQACVESSFGLSLLSYKYHNYFGMKCGSSWKGRSVNLKTKEEYKQGELATISDNFRVYDNIDEGVKGYFNFISLSRYSNLKTATTPQQYLEFIKEDGYSTSSSYVTLNMNVIKKYSLTQFDNVFGNNKEISYDDITVDVNPFREPTVLIGLNSRGEGAKWVQWFLWRFGLITKKEIDGIIGNKSYKAIKTAQERLGLEVDGIVGKNTRNVFKEACKGGD